jgi:transcriptional regulator with XRE-family HTH domain
MPPASTDLSKRILAARLRRGLSQRLVSRRSGLDPGYLSRIEHGRIHPTLGTALRIADALGVQLGEILSLPSTGANSGPCPVSTSGRCLIDLMGSGAEPGLEKQIEHYSPRQLRLLRQFAALLAHGDQDVLKAFETLIRKVGDEQNRKTGVSSDPPP